MGRHSNYPRWASEQSRAAFDGRRRITVAVIAAVCVVAVALAGCAIAIAGARRHGAASSAAAVAKTETPAVKGVDGAAKSAEPNEPTKPATRGETAAEHTALDRKQTLKADERKTQTAERQTLLAALQSQLSGKTAQYQGSWQVYVEDLDSGATAVVNSHQSYSASVVKLMVMLAVFQKVSEGALAEDASLDGLLEQMITVSSNEATNALVERLGSGNINAGFGVVNSVAAQYGFNESHLNSRMGDLSNYSTKQTSVADQGRFLAAAYRGQLVSAGYSKRMTDIMSRQTRRAKIPAGLPQGVACANKTGEAPGVENDSAIVYGEHPYVIAVMSSDVPDSSAAQAQIRDISSTVWASLQ